MEREFYAKMLLYGAILLLLSWNTIFTLIDISILVIYATFLAIIIFGGYKYLEKK